MRILYGVVGEGMGHATRSRVVIGHLLDQGHQLFVVVSGRAHRFLSEAFADRRGSGPGQLELREISGLHLIYDEGGVDKSASLWSNLDAAPAGIRRNLDVYAQVVGGFAPEAVVSDFESWAYLYARRQDIPVLSIDNMQVINRCRHDPALTSAPDGLPDLDYALARLSVKVKLPGAWHYLVTSFFHPPVQKPRTTLVPPILRPELLAARREPGAHVLVYQTADASRALLPTLSRLAVPFRVYGVGLDHDVGPNVSLRPFSQDGFIDDLRTARAVIAGGGFSLMSEAVHLHVPMLSVPLQAQFEQELNARWLQRLGYGRRELALDGDVVTDFLAHTDDYSAHLEAYVPRDNSMLLGCVDEALARMGRGEPRAATLDAPNLGDIVSAAIDRRLGPDAPQALNR